MLTFAWHIWSVLMRMHKQALLPPGISPEKAAQPRLVSSFFSCNSNNIEIKTRETWSFSSKRDLPFA